MMREKCKQYLEALQSRKEKEILFARQAFEEMFRADYFGERKLWVKTHADEVGSLREKPVRQMTLHEVMVCLTNIVARDRIYGAMSGCEKTGMMENLLQQYLRLTETNA